MKRRYVRAALTAVAVAAIAMLAAGCHGGGKSGSSGGSSSASGGGGGSSGGGTLTIGVDNGSPTLQRNFNPFAGSHRTATTYMYEPLEFVNTLDGSYTPFLATAHKFLGNTKVQFTIRSGVKWSDGKPFGPQDVVYTFNLLKKQSGLDTLGIWQHVQSVSADGQNVTFTFKTPDVPFAQQISSVPIVPQHVWSKVSNPTTFTNPNPVVTGPYVLDSFNPNQYTLKKNPSYWQAGKVAADQIAFPALTGNQNSQLELSQGSYDWATLFIPNVKKTWVSKDPAHNKYWFPPGGVVSLYLNLTKPPFDNASFRQGLSYGIDRGAVATKAEDGYVQPASQSGVLLPNLQKWLDPSLPNQGKVAVDEAKAKSLFAKAGYHDQGGKLVGPDGKQASFSIILPNGFTDWLQGAQVVQQQLQKLGIAVTIKTPEYAAYFSSLQNGTFDTAFGGFGGTGNPYLDFSGVLSSTLTAPVGKPAASNFERFKDPATDALLNQLKSTTSQAQQHKAVNGLQKVMYDQVPVVALFYGASWGEYSTKSFTGWPSAANPYAPAIPYNWAPLMIVTHLKAA